MIDKKYKEYIQSILLKIINDIGPREEVGSLRQLMPDDLVHGQESDKKLVHATACRVIA